MSRCQPQLPSAKLERLMESAAKRGKEMTLTLPHVEKLLAQTHCAYSGEKFENRKGEYLSFERFNNDIGYIEGNVIAVKAKYNNVRDSHSLSDLKALLHSAQMDLILTKDGKLRKTKNDTIDIKYTKIKNVLRITRDMEKQLAKRIKAEKVMSASKKMTEQLQTDLGNMRLKIESYKTAIANSAIQIVCIVNSLSLAPVTSERIKAIETRVHTYDILVKGVERFENLSFLDKLKVKKALPLNASIFKLIKG